MNKKKIGIVFYYTSLILAIALLLSVLIFMKNDDAEILSIYRYMACYFSFSVIIPVGLIVREFLLEEYVMKKMTLKIVIVVVFLIGGVFASIFIKVASVALVLFLASLLALLFIMVPSVPKNHSEGK